MSLSAGSFPIYYREANIWYASMSGGIPRLHISTG